MVITKRKIASAVKRFPQAMGTAHALWRLTRPHFTAGVVGVVFNPRGEVLIVEHVYHTAPQWGLPGGYVDRGEAPDEALVRELREELELVASVETILAVERNHGNHFDFAYLCRAEGDIGNLCGELMDYRWVPPNDLPDMRSFQQRAISLALGLTESTL